VGIDPTSDYPLAQAVPQGVPDPAALDRTLRQADDAEVQAALGETMGGPVLLPGGFAMPVQVERVLGFGRSFSFWPLLFGLACCAIEMMALGGARFDMSRFGMEAMRASPRQADGMIVAGWCTTNMAPRVVRLYEQIPDPKWVLAMGSCAISGNIWNTYSVVQGIDALIPVDVYVPGCPPRPEALWQGLEMIRERIKESRHAYDGLRRIPARDAMADEAASAAGQEGLS
jgi:NADH-quinone oxidoreductase subunit B